MGEAPTVNSGCWCRSIVYFNDMPNVISSDLYMFADDTKLYCTITSELDCNILQQDLNNVINWGNMWLTNFNLPKCM